MEWQVNKMDLFLRGCAGKTQHKTYLSADYFLENLHSNTDSEIYKCKACKFFHIGRSKQAKKGIKRTIKIKGNDEHKHKHKRFKY
jgi:hypothetical protein